MLFTYKLRTDTQKLHNITSAVEKAVEESGILDGICVVYSPHTTAGITVNEAADPDVASDVILSFDDTVKELREFRHYEGNSTAHVKTSMVGPSQSLIISDGKLLLGTWQGVYFAEFDGPRNRTFYVKVISG